MTSRQTVLRVLDGKIPDRVTMPFQKKNDTKNDDKMTEIWQMLKSPY